jgi:hypothetical protein
MSSGGKGGGGGAGGGGGGTTLASTKGVSVNDSKGTMEDMITGGTMTVGSAGGGGTGRFGGIPSNGYGCGGHMSSRQLDS